MRPRIICHMLSSIDGRIDGEILNNVIAVGLCGVIAAMQNPSDS